MSRINRYNFTKLVYPNSVVLIKYKDKYITYDNDRFICDYISFYSYDKKEKYKFGKFFRYKINYLVLDELDIVRFKKFAINNYDKYVYVTNLRIIVKKIGNKLIRR